MTDGKYRISFGAPIVDASYNYETHEIGPYKCPFHIGFHAESSGERGYSEYQFYEIFRLYEDALAVFVVNNYFFCVIHKNRVTYQPFIIHDDRSRKRLPEVPKGYKMEPIPTYEHIGYIKTYGQNKNVFAYPDYLVRNVATGEVPYVKDQVSGKPLINPPVTLYKELLKTDAKAVYFDTASSKPIFIN